MRSDSTSVLTPYLYHPLDPRRFRRNVGDGLILKAIERRAGPFPPEAILSTRHRPGRSAYRHLAQGRAIILAGANQLQDDFSPWPGLTPDEHRRSNLVFVPYGVGLGGKEDNSGARLTPAAIEHLDILHDRIEFSSWRCPRTVAALNAALPHRSGQFLMTACPAALDRPLLDGQPFENREGVVAVTVTDRGDFAGREMPVLERIAQLYPKARRLLVLHNDFLFWLGPLRAPPLPLPGMAAKRLALRRRASALGYEIVTPRSGDEAWRLYAETVDIHFGSRLHAHLIMLSQAKPSHLVFVDERATGMAEALDFLLCPAQSVDANIGFDFERVRAAARKADEQMCLFEQSLARLGVGATSGMAKPLTLYGA